MCLDLTKEDLGGGDSGDSCVIFDGGSGGLWPLLTPGTCPPVFINELETNSLKEFPSSSLGILFGGERGSFVYSFELLGVI